MILAADNINPMNPAVADAIERIDPAPIQYIARKCEQRGAALIDINPGYLSKRRRDRMKFLVESVQEVTRLRLVLDSPDPEILEDGLKSCVITPVINALTKEPRKLEKIIPLAVDSGADLVILLLDERSMCPADIEGKLSLAMEIRETALSAGIHEDRLIFDPVMPSFSWPDAMKQAGECVKAVRMLANGTLFGKPARTIVGLSNLMSGQRHPEKNNLERTLLAVLAGAGLDIALGNVLNDSLLENYKLISEILSL